MSFLRLVEPPKPRIDFAGCFGQTLVYGLFVLTVTLLCAAQLW